MKMTKQQGKAKAKGCKTTNHQANFDTSSDTLLHVACGTTGFLLFVTILSGIVLSSTTIHAANPAQSNVTVNVNTACTASGGGTYSAKAVPGNTVTIAGSTFSTVCNDSEGYSIYAVGYGGESYDAPTNTQMIGTGSIGNIVTGTAKSGNTSNWAMQVTPTSGSAPTITNGFDSANFHVVPEDYAQVAKYTSTTASPTATGARIDAKYQVYVISTQAIGTYIGKVKYIMVHPNDAPAPSTATTFDQAFADAGKTKQGNYYKMQDGTASICEAVTEGQVGQLIDPRDNEVYYVGKLKDGKCWMLDNLRLGDSSTISLTPADTNIASNYTLPASGTANFNSSTGYTTAAVNADYKNTTTTSYGAGSGKIGNYYTYCSASAGTYCYAEGSGTGNARYDICPAGWRMPKGGDSGEYQALYTSYSISATDLKIALSTPLSGVFTNGLAYYQGGDGHFWSSTMYDGSYMYKLRVDSGSGAYPTGDMKRYNGGSVRCLLRS